MEQKEFLAIFDEHGKQIGVKERRKAHIDGDWHILVFVIAARINGNQRIRSIMQKRSGLKDPYHGQIDLLAGGHVLSSEKPLDGAIRECDEESGVMLEKDDLVLLGKHSLENLGATCKRVVEYFYLCRRQITLSDVRFSNEVNAFAEVDLHEFDDLLTGKRSSIPSLTRTSDRPNNDLESMVTSSDLAAYSPEIKENFRLVIRSVCHYLLTGRVDLRIWE